MELKEIYDLSRDEKRIKVAEAIGYRMVERFYAFPSVEMVKNRYSPEIFEQLVAFEYEVIPEYLDDLNAMFEVEKIFYATGEPWFRYIRLLQMECADGEPCGGDNPIHATAEQRAIAFLIWHYTDYEKPDPEQEIRNYDARSNV